MTGITIGAVEFISMSSSSINNILGISVKSLAIIIFLAFLPAMTSELVWLYKGKKVACAKLRADYATLLASSTALNARAFSPGDGSAINQAFLGTVLASSTQAPNATRIQATLLGCDTSSYPTQTTLW